MQITTTSSGPLSPAITVAGTNNSAAVTYLRVEAVPHRTVTYSNRDEMLTILRSAPKREVIVTVPYGDREASDYAKRLIMVFTDAGIQCWCITAMDPHSWDLFPGVSIFASNKEGVAAQVAAIKRAIAITGVDCRDAREPASDGDINLIVGPMP